MCGIKPTEWGDCVGDVVGGATDAVASSAADSFFQFIADGMRDVLETLSTFWMKVPSPEVASGSGQSWTGSETITSIQSWIAPVGFVIFTITLGIALVKISYDTRRAGEGFNAIIRSLVTTLAGGLPLLAVTMLGIQFGDLFSPWILEQASGESTSEGFKNAFVGSMVGPAGGQGTGALLILYIVAILGSLAQIVFMVVRGAAMIVLLSFAQVVAAGTATEEGWQRFKRLCMLIVGFVFYKPVAAVIYGVGLKLMSDGADSSDQLMNAIYGLTVIVMAVLALPAFIKFVAPAAAMGSSSAFSGGAALGVAATGAAVVALAGTGGASAAAGGAGGGGAAAGGGTGATMNPGAASSESAGAAGGGTGGSGGSSGGDGGGDGGAVSEMAESSSGSGSPQAGSPSGAATADTNSTAPVGGDGGGKHRGGSVGTQMGAQTVQNISGQVNQAGDDASPES